MSRPWKKEAQWFRRCFVQSEYLLGRHAAAPAASAAPAVSWIQLPMRNWRRRRRSYPRRLHAAPRRRSQRRPTGSIAIAASQEKTLIQFAATAKEGRQVASEGIAIATAKETYKQVDQSI